MTIRVRNVKYFDWEVPEELVAVGDEVTREFFQQLIDEHFDPTDLSVAKSGYDYYEFEEVL